MKQDSTVFTEIKNKKVHDDIYNILIQELEDKKLFNDVNEKIIKIGNLLKIKVI